MPITALPSLDRTSATFKTDLDGYFLSALPVFSSEANALQTDVNAKQVTASAAAVTATTQADSAAASALAALGSAGVAGAVAWVSGTTYAVGDARYSLINMQTYRRKVAGAGATDPSADLTNWTPAVEAGASLLRSARTSNTVLGTADKGKLIDITSGTFTQTFATVATLADGWFCYLKNSGTGDITLDPNASELIDGLTSYVMYPGECRLVQCDGAALRSMVLNGFYRTFTTTGTFTRPPGYTTFSALLFGGGGSGAKNVTAAGGGGGGACFPVTVPIAEATTTITVGAGGVAKTTAGVGLVGGITSINGYAQSYGGGGGGVWNGTNAYGGGGGGATSAGASGPTASGAATGGNPGGYNTGAGIYAAQTYGGGGGDASSVALYGGGGGAYNLGNGGSSMFGGCGGGCGLAASTAGGIPLSAGSGGSGGGGGDASNGVDGVAPGGGGGGTRSGAQSGAGARGEVRIWGII